MNDLYAADPKIGRDAFALKFLFSLFGHSCGRYLADFPPSWRADVLRAAKGLGDIDEARLRVLLRRAKEQGVFRLEPSMKWDDNISWLHNLSREITLHPQILSGIILDIGVLAPEPTHSVPTWSLSELPLSPTAEERIVGTAAEYCRICHPLLASSTEITFIDPYLDFRKRAVIRAVEPMLERIRKSASQRVLFHTRAVSSNDMQECVAHTEEQLNRITSLHQSKSRQKIEVLWWDDDQANERMHGRYLLSNKGGIRLDQGFQVLPAGRMVDVAPVSPQLHFKLCNLFFDHDHDMKLVASIVIQS